MPRTAGAHSLIVTPAGRRSRHRAHALVCGRPPLGATTAAAVAAQPHGLATV